MKTTASNIEFSYWHGSADEADETPVILLRVNLSRNEAIRAHRELKPITENDKLLSVEIKPHRNRRSLDANAYMWVLLDKIAEVLHTSKDELYIQMLDRYGVFTHTIVKPEAVEMFKLQWRTVRELGEVTVNGKPGVQLQCYFGSSTYDTKQMAKLIDGIVSEAKELDIETLPPDEVEALKSLWDSIDIMATV